MILDLPEVLEGCTITGSSEYVLKMATEDHHAYNNLRSQKLFAIPHGPTFDSSALRFCARAAVSDDIRTGLPVEFQGMTSGIVQWRARQ